MIKVLIGFLINKIMNRNSIILFKRILDRKLSFF